MSTNVQFPPLGQATVPLTSFIRPHHRHYFSGRPERPNYRVRKYDFPGIVHVMPLVRAYLDTCAAEYPSDFRYLFTLLGSELANNAIRHSLSSRPGCTYSLIAERHSDGLRLICRDRGNGDRHPQPLRVAERALDLEAESGRGLAIVDAFAHRWGERARFAARDVWFFLGAEAASKGGRGPRRGSARR